MRAWLRKHRRTIEAVYQCDVKGYDPGGKNWRVGKGKPPKDPTVDLYTEYKALWEEWVRENPKLLEELRMKAVEHNYVLTDMFATSSVNQARALAEILNDHYG